MSGSVRTADNTGVSGLVELRRKLAGESSFKTVATDTASPYFEFRDQKALRNATYQVVFVGDATYASSLVQGELKVMRDLGDKISNLKLQGKVKPKYKKKKVTIEIKTSKNGKWKKWAS